MRFTFSDPGDGGLRTIDHLPDGRLIRLQGRNGVGKTVSMRLLALSTGAENPWIDERQSWRSLVRILPDGFAITATDGERTVSWTLYPKRDKWPEELPTVQDSELARARQSALETWTPPVEVRIDGVVREESRPVEVRLLSGREGLLEVWTQQVRTDGRRFERLSETATAAVDNLRDVFGHLQQSWEDADPAHLAKARKAHQELHGRLDAEQSKLELLERIARQAQISQQRAERLSEAEKAVPDIDETMSRIAEELSELRVARDTLTGELNRAATGGDLTPKQREELDRALRNERSRRDAHADASSTLMRLLERPELEGIRRSDVPGELRRTRQEIRSTQKEIDRIHRDEPVLDLAHRLRVTITDHPAPDEALLLGSANVTATVAETEGALAERIGSLEAAGPLQRLESERSALGERFKLLQAVVEAERVLGQKSRLVAEVSAAIAQQKQRDQQIDDLARRQAETEAEIEQLQEQLVDLRDRRRALLGDAEDLNELRLAVTADRPDPADVPNEAELTERRALVAQLAAEVDNATKEIRRAKDAATAARHVLDQYGLTPRPTEGSDPLLEADEAIAQVQRHLDLGRASFHQLVDVLTKQSPLEGASVGAATKRLARRYARDWQAELSSEAFQDELFEGGELASIDILEGFFAWVDPQGRDRRRPIQALSSGQMVYAYTKAVIADMSPPPVNQHRVIVLDEFAAYLDEHAQQQLVDDLRHHVRSHERTQIIMVLPRDPGNERGWTAEVVE